MKTKKPKPPEPYALPWLTPGELAARLKCSEGTLANWRSEGTGPKFKHIGQRRNSPVRYNIKDVLEWEKKNWS